MLTLDPAKLNNRPENGQRQLPWHGPNRLWSLWEMIKLYGNLLLLLKAIRMCQSIADGDGMADSARVNQNLRAYLREILADSIRSYCEQFEMKPALDRIARIEKVLENEHDCTHVNLRHQFKTLHENIEDDLRDRLFWYVPTAKIEHVLPKKDIPFRDGPELAFARNEWYEAEKCYGLERYTASVMHLMRLAELGLRVLTRRLVGDRVNDRDIEFVDWRPMLEAVEPIVQAKLKWLENQPRTAEREQAVSFYSSVTSHLRYFKTIRDEAAHARGIYDEEQALSALQRIEEFMSILAESLDTIK